MGAPGCIPEHLEETNFSTSPFLPLSLGVVPVRKTFLCPLSSRCSYIGRQKEQGCSGDFSQLVHLDTSFLKSHHLQLLPWTTTGVKSSPFNEVFLADNTLILMFYSNTSQLIRLRVHPKIAHRNTHNLLQKPQFSIWTLLH